MALLADKVLARPLFSDRAACRVLEGAVRSAHVFELSPEFAAAADQLRGSRPSAFAHVVHLCKLPYDSVWFEVAYRDRPSFVNGDGNPLDYPSTLDRIGVLVSKSARAGCLDMQLFWSFEDGRVSTSHFDALVSLEEESTIVAIMRPDHHALIREMYPPRERDAAMRMFGRFALRPGRFRNYEIGRVTPFSPLYDQLATTAEHDWAGEVQYWLAAIALLNARNVSDREEVDNRERNRLLRRKGSKKPPLLSFTRCVISARLRERMAEAARGLAADTRLHFVRGHLKARSTGIYWWTPFVRGKRELGVVHKRYEVA